MYKNCYSLLNWVCYKSEILYIDLLFLSDPCYVKLIYVDKKKNQDSCSLTPKMSLELTGSDSVQKCRVLLPCVVGGDNEAEIRVLHPHRWRLHCFQIQNSTD